MICSKCKHNPMGVCESINKEMEKERNQYCESCKYFCKINDATGVCCVEPGPYKSLPYERKACRYYEFDYNSLFEEKR